MAIYSLAREVGLQCFPGEEAAAQAELNRSVDKLGAFILQNSKTSSEDLAKFRKDQGGVGAPKARLCTGDAVAIYHAFTGGGAERLRSSVDKVVVRPGPPTWGTCL